jgi:hypothetical protein
MREKSSLNENSLSDWFPLLYEAILKKFDKNPVVSNKAYIPGLDMLM